MSEPTEGKWALQRTYEIHDPEHGNFGVVSEVIPLTICKVCACLVPADQKGYHVAAAHPGTEGGA